MRPLTRARTLGLLAAASALPYRAPARAQTTKLRIAVIATDSYAEPYYAIDRGFFANAGLDVDLHAFTTGGAITVAIAAGALDVGMADPIQVGDAVNRGIPFKFFAGASEYSTDAPTTQLCVLQGGPVKSVKDLAGRTLGVFGLKSMPAYATRAWLEAHGVDSAAVTFVEIPPSAMVPAIARGTVVAGVVSEPMLSRAPLSNVVAFAKIYDACAKHFYINSWFANQDWIRSNAETVRKLTAAIYETAHWANAHHADSLAILAKYGKLDVAGAQNMQRAPYGTTLDPGKVEPPLALAWRFHGLQKELTAADLIAKS